MPIDAGTLLKDRYRLEQLLGRGGMASVWLAADEVLERPVAIKILSDTIASDPEFVARFRREARVAAGLSHPNLIGIYDYAADSERPYLVMEYIEGETLAERISRRAPTDCRELARELLGALAHIHAAGIVHRDVKPQNILIDAEGRAKLIDFGIALPADATSLTRTGQFLGTARFIAPEVAHGGPATERSDLYSCGIVLRDCCREGGTDPLGDLVESLSAERPESRPVSAAAGLAALERLSSPERFAVVDEPTVPYEVQPAPVPEDLEPGSDRRDRGSRPWGRAVAVVALIGVALVVALVVGGGDDSGDGGRGTQKAAQQPTDRGAGRSAVAADDGGATEEPPAAEEPEAESEEDGSSESVPAPAGSDPELGSALNEEGFQLINDGRYEEAVPVLEEAVRAFPPQTEDVDYGYALFNLGNALRLSGRPEEAIPVLERRLEIPNQTEAVSAELAMAREEASS
jgi:eukaryotic-like serine/threonine-protein kinase